MALVFAITLVLQLVVKKWSKSLIVGYVLLIFGETLLFRIANGTMQAELTPLWSYRNWNTVGLQIIANVMLFIPFGIIGASIWRWRSVVYAAGLSCIIELAQLIFRRGLFEFDDIIHNSLGAVIGCLLYMFIQKDRGQK